MKREKKPLIIPQYIPQCKQRHLVSSHLISWRSNQKQERQRNATPRMPNADIHPSTRSEVRTESKSSRYLVGRYVPLSTRPPCEGRHVHYFSMFERVELSCETSLGLPCRCNPFHPSRPATARPVQQRNPNSKIKGSALDNCFSVVVWRVVNGYREAAGRVSLGLIRALAAWGECSGIQHVL